MDIRCLVYDYQSLIGGLLALLAGLLAYSAAMKAERRKDRQHREKQQNFAISIVLRLRVVQEELANVSDGLIHDMNEELRKGITPKPRDLSFSSVPETLWEAWTLDFGLPTGIMVKIEKLHEDLTQCKEASKRLTAALTQFDSRGLDPRQMTIRMFDSDEERIDREEEVNQLFQRNIKWFESSVDTIDRLLEEFANHFLIDLKKVDKLWEEPDT